MMIRVNLVLLALLVGCALSLVTSRHQARRLFVELERGQEQARAYETEYGRMQLPSAARTDVVVLGRPAEATP